MAEQEVIKHTKKVYKVWNSKEHSFWHKAKEFAIEILIIVFAVSLSIWFHNWSEHRHEQKQVKSFLLGLKTDIAEDIAETNELISIFKQNGKSYKYLGSLTEADLKLNDTLVNEMNGLFSNAYLRPNISRYSGFSMSGKLTTIENEKLLQNILNLYQELIPRIKSSEGGYNEMKAELGKFVIDNTTSPDDVLSKAKVLMTPKGKILCSFLVPGDQLFERYNDFINAGNEIIQQINKEYGLEQ